jgi:membrane protein DedA with SNARE-associated domain
MKKLLVEAFMVGVMVVVIGTIVSYVIGKFTSTDLPPVCKDWNKNYIMELTLFIIGVITHILCEYTGLNKWYCRNGVACK